ncbi:hypothetical protein EB796_019999 [Bugula neritina]|uniref:Transporter n=1 Tax=Bugula neritina TaxID=10212 RepID=A0A7J7J624_BUGNE|nr:hypothetical protein EB796_019999 [Bugula neritina]
MLHSFEVCCCNYFINLMADSKDKSQLSLGHRFLKSVLGDNDNTTPAKISPDDEDNQVKNDRGKWGSKAEFILSALGYAVGLGNVWRFPWLCWKNGGGAFLIPYFIMLAFAGLPIFFMEVILGQYSGVGPNKLFELAPLFKGLGIGMITISFFSSLYYNAVIMWSIYYMFSSFQSPLPWVGCDNKWNSDKCFDAVAERNCEKTENGSIYLFRQCYNASVVALNDIIPEFNNTIAGRKAALLDSEKVPAAQEFFNDKMYAQNYQDEDGYNTGVIRPMDDIGAPKWDITLTLLFSWIVVYLCVLKGIKTSGKVVYFTATFPYVVILVLLIYGATLDGARDGIEFYMTPNFTKLGSPEIWVDAAGQIFFSLSVGMGGLMTYSSYNTFNNNILRDTLIVCIGNCVTSIIAGFPIFSILGFLALQLGKKVPEVVESGSALAFIAYPEVVSQMPAPPFWSIIFFFMLLTLGLDSQFAGIEVIMTAIIDNRPKLVKWKPLIAAIICSFMFLITINMTCDAGIYWEELVNYFSGWSLVLIGFAEVVVYGWVYGAENILDNVQEMLGWKFHPFGWWYFRILWKVVTPLLLLVVVVFNFIQTGKLSYGNYLLPNWAQTIGWLVAVLPILIIPIYAVMVIVYDYLSLPDSEESIWQRIRRLTRPSDKWVSSPVRYGEVLANTANGEMLSKSNNAADNVAYSASDSKATIVSYNPKSS